MATVFDDTTGHPVTSTIAAISEQLHDVADLGLWALGPAETDANVTALAQLRHQIDEIELRHAHDAERLGLGTAAGATDTASHWAQPDPGRPNGTPSAACSLPTPWTSTTNRSGTRWLPASSLRNRRA